MPVSIAPAPKIRENRIAANGPAPVLIAAETGISRQDFENMIPLEKELFEELMKCIDLSDKKLNQSLEGKKQEDFKNDLVVFKESVDEFLDLEGNMVEDFNINSRYVT